MNATLWAAVAGAVGVTVGAVGSSWFAYRTEERRARHEQQRRDGDVLGALTLYLVDTQVERLGFNAPLTTEDCQGLFKALRARRDALRLALQVMAASHPDPRIDELATNLEITLFTALHWTEMHLSGTRGAGIGLDRVMMLERAQSEHRRAEEQRQALLAEVRRYGRGKPWKQRPPA